MLYPSVAHSANELKMYEAAKAVYQKEISDLQKVVCSTILSAHIFFECREKQTQNYFSHQVLYKNNAAGIPPELVDFLKLHIQALQEAVQIIDKKIQSLQTATA